MATNYITPNWLIPENSNQDKKSYSFDFDGTNHINFGNPTEVQITGNITISAWIKTTNSASQAIVGKDDNNTIAGRSYLFQTLSVARFIIWRSNSIYIVAGTTAIDDGNWHHVVGVNDGTSLKVYVDGALDSPANSDGGAIDNDAVSFWIGGRSASGSPTYFNGNIGEVAVWNIALTSGNVTTLYGDATNGVGNPMDLTTKPVGYWSADSSTFGSVFNVQNKATELFSNYSFDFDGSNDYIDCGTGLSLLGGACTFSAWCYMDDATSFRVLHKGYAANREYAFGTGTGDTFFLLLYNSTSHPTVTGIGQISTVAVTAYQGEWIHLAATYDGSGSNTGIQLYINGATIAQTAYSLGTYSAPANLGGDVYIGRYNLEYADGNITEIAVWDSELTPANVTTIYNSGKPADLTSLSPVSWWRLGEQSFWDGTNWVVRDQIGSNDGTSANMATDDIEGDAPNTSGSGTSSGLGVEDRTGDLKYSESNAVSFNMAYDTRVTSVP